MFLRASILIAVFAASLMGCKARKNSSVVRDAAGYDAKYKGPNMSDQACVEDPAKCNCLLANEYDKFKPQEGNDPNAGTPGQREWYRQCIGQQIWTYATGTSSRFHTYVTAQRYNVPGDYGLTFHTEDRNHRFQNWGLINDPSCCVPPSAPGANDGTCGPEVSVTREDTFGFDYCPGDDVLLTYVGKQDKDYTKVDPACNISKLEQRIGAGLRNTTNNEDTQVPRSDSCFLEFGTSAGAVGWRKFPNPRFDAEKWRRLNDGSASSWVNYSHRVPGRGGIPDYDKEKAPNSKLRLDDGSVEPPFHIGQSCGSCHVGFKPDVPPADPENPTWDNIQYAIGNNFIHVTEIHAAGAAKDSFEFNYAGYARPGTVDTSAATNDYVFNPGTFNALINLDRRPGLMDGSVHGTVGAHAMPFVETVSTWKRKLDGSFSFVTERGPIAHILKGGEDSVDPGGGILRVYANIFACTETCLANHLDDPRAFSGRGSRQTPFELDQCRRDCPGYTAVEDRVYDVIDFILRVRPNDLKDAKDPPEIAGGVDGKAEIDKIMTKDNGDWYKAGKQVFAEKCAQCHSNLAGQAETAGLFDGASVRNINVNTFLQHVEDRNADGVRQEWFGSDVLIPQKVVDTHRCRAMHSNHMAGHLWEGYASDSYRDPARYDVSPDDMFNYPEEALNKQNLGGRGFYRNISLLNAWAHAPFMHNNAVGPEWYSPFWGMDRGVPGKKWASIKPNPSVKTRLEMYERSMEELFKPETERESTGSVPYKVTLTASRINFLEIPIIPDVSSLTSLPSLRSLQDVPATALRNVWSSEFWTARGLTNMLANAESEFRRSFRSIQVGLPAGIPVSVFSSIRLKQIMHELMLQIKTQPNILKKAEAAQQYINSIFGNLVASDPNAIARNLAARHLSNCADLRENGGHDFSDLNADQKKQIIDFLKTL